MKTAGLIGVGLLGSALADRLIDDGIKVHGFDTNEGQLKTLTQRGGIACDSAAQVLQGCDALFLSLPTSDVVLSLVQQLRSDFSPGQIVLDTTTGDPTQAIAVGRLLAELGVHYLEATVAGSSAQVRAGLHIRGILGAEEAQVEHVRLTVFVYSVPACVDVLRRRRRRLNTSG